MSTLSVIVSTYNRSHYLRACVASLERQSRPPDEVIVADDGSRPEHVEVVREIVGTSSLPITHVWQEDRGFRLATSRNRAAESASGDILLFTDGDAVFAPNVLALHLAHAREGVFTSGLHVKLTPEETALVTPEVVRGGRLHNLVPPPSDPRMRRLRRHHRRYVRRVLLARLRPSERRLRKVKMHGLQGAVARSDFERVNGYDEHFVGWGGEDHDLGLRLCLSGVVGRSVIAEAIALHQWHPRAPRAYDPVKQRRASANARYLRRPRNGEFVCSTGLRDLGAGSSP